MLNIAESVPPISGTQSSFNIRELIDTDRVPSIPGIPGIDSGSGTGSVMFNIAE
jgi:hypothetical protein